MLLPMVVFVNLFWPELDYLNQGQTAIMPQCDCGYDFDAGVYVCESKAVLRRTDHMLATTSKLQNSFLYREPTRVYTAGFQICSGTKI